MEMRQEPTPKEARILGHRELLGTLADWDLARKLRVSASLVGRVRKALGIPPFGGERPRRRPYSRPKASLLAQHHHLVGTIPDEFLARKLGISVGTVSVYRRAHGIGRCAPDGANASDVPLDWLGPRLQTRVVLERNRALVGRLSDRDVARRLGIKESSVTAFRRKHGIRPQSRPAVRRADRPTLRAVASRPRPVFRRRAQPTQAGNGICG